MKKVKLPALRACLQARKPEIINYLEKICTTKSDLFWYKKSKSPNVVTLVCHIDTSIGDTDRVWNQKKMEYVDAPIRRRILFDPRYQVFVGPDGLGADDRAGLFGILRVYNAMPDDIKPNLLFCDGEESGGKGATSASVLLPELQDSLFLIELDRRGKNDCVFYNKEPKDFVKQIESFGFKENSGTFSDVSTLGRKFNLCSTNLSVGYYNEHTRYETLYCRTLNDTIEKTIKLVEFSNREGKVWAIPPEPPPKKYDYGSYNRDRDWENEGYWGCSKWMQRSLGYDKNRKVEVYTQEELRRYPYLAEMQRLRCV